MGRLPNHVYKHTTRKIVQRASAYTHTLVHCDGRQDLRGTGHVKLVVVDTVGAVLGTVVGHLRVVLSVIAPVT